MGKYLEIRWYGKAGQGVFTAAYATADILSADGKYVQSFPGVRVEKGGNPIIAYNNRISDSPIKLRSNLNNVDVVAVFDPTLFLYDNLGKDTRSNTIFIVNTSYEPEFIKEKFDLNKNKIFTLDANKISEEETGRVIPNIPIVTVVMDSLKIISLENYAKNMKEFLLSKLDSGIVSKNLNTIERSLKEVRES